MSATLTAAESAAAHTVLMGRRTYEVLASLPTQHRDESWEAMINLPTVVFSRTLGAVDWPGARLHRPDAVDEVRRLKTLDDVAPLRSTGSLSIARQLLAAGLVDRLRLLTFPCWQGNPAASPRSTTSAQRSCSWWTRAFSTGESSSPNTGRPSTTSPAAPNNEYQRRTNDGTRDYLMHNCTLRATMYPASCSFHGSGGVIARNSA